MIKILIDGVWHEFEVGNVTLTKQLYDPTQPLLGQGEYTYTFKIRMERNRYAQLFSTRRLSSWVDGYESQLITSGVSLNGWFVLSKIEADGVSGSFSDRRNFRTLLSDRNLTDLRIREFDFTGLFDDMFMKLPYNPDKVSIHSLMGVDDSVAPALILTSKLPNSGVYSFDLNIPKWNVSDFWCISSNAQEIYRLDGSLNITLTLTADLASLDESYAINRTFRDTKEEWDVPQFYRSNGSTFERIGAARQALVKDWKDMRLGVRLSDIVKSIFTENGYKIDSVLLNDEQFRRIYWFNETEVEDIATNSLSKLNYFTDSMRVFSMWHRGFDVAPLNGYTTYGLGTSKTNNAIDVYNEDLSFPQKRWYVSETSGETQPTPNTQTLNYSLKRSYLGELYAKENLWTVVSPSMSEPGNLSYNRDCALSLNLDQSPNDGLAQLGDNVGGEWVVPFDGTWRINLVFRQRQLIVYGLGVGPNDSSIPSETVGQYTGVVLFKDNPDFNKFWYEVTSGSPTIESDNILSYTRILRDVNVTAGNALCTNARQKNSSDCTNISNTFIEFPATYNYFTTGIGNWYEASYNSGQNEISVTFDVPLKKNERIRMGLFMPTNKYPNLASWNGHSGIRFNNLNSEAFQVNIECVSAPTTITAGNLLKKDTKQLDFLKQFMQIFNQSLLLDEVNKTAVLYDNIQGVSDLRTITPPDDYSLVEINNTERVSMPRMTFDEPENTVRGASPHVASVGKGYQPDAPEVDMTMFSGIPALGYLITDDVATYRTFMMPVPIFSTLEDFNVEQNDPEIYGSMKPLMGSLLLSRGYQSTFGYYLQTPTSAPSKVLMVDGVIGDESEYFFENLPMWEVKTQLTAFNTPYNNLAPYPIEQVNEFNTPTAFYLYPFTDVATSDPLTEFWTDDRLYRFTETVVLTVPYFPGAIWQTISPGTWVSTRSGRFLVVRAEWQTGERTAKLTCLRPM